MQPFSLLLKPVSGDCNLRCVYCFYKQGPHRMEESVLRQIIAGYLRTPQPVYAFNWQGGEPLLAGRDFYRNALELMRRLAPPKAMITNAIQTNGTLLDDAWGEFLARNHFLVGVSLDGPQEVHDANRPDAGGRGSHAAVLRGIEALRRHGVEFNLLTLVNARNVKPGAALYRYLRDEAGCRHHQYIECTDPGSPHAVSAEAWGEFLCEVFDEWIANNDPGRVSVRLFDSILNRLVCNHIDSCAMSRECGQYLVIEHDGSVYPCDFFVRPEWRLGNIGETPLESLLRTPLARRFARLKSEVPAECRSCPYFPLCAGDCTRNRETAAPSRLCAGWKRFYGYTLERFRKIADACR